MGILTPGSETPGAKDMGETHAQLTLSNLFNKKSVTVRALVDTGLTWMTVTEETARNLGFDPSECSTDRVELADGRTIEVPVIIGLKVEFEGRASTLEALIMGNQCLVGVFFLEALDLMVDPGTQRVVGKHPRGRRLRFSDWPQLPPC